MLLNEKVYQVGKWIVQIFLPAFGALYFSLSDLWNLPEPLKVVGTVTILATFLGTILGISSYNYRRTNEQDAGYFVRTGTDDDTGLPQIGLTVSKHPVELLDKKTVTFKVEPPPPNQP